MNQEQPDSAMTPPTQVKKSDGFWLAVLGNAVIASIFTSTAYLVGVVFQQQHMSTLRFNYELYPKSAAQYFFIHSSHSFNFYCLVGSR